MTAPIRGLHLGRQYLEPHSSLIQHNGVLFWWLSSMISIDSLPLALILSWLIGEMISISGWCDVPTSLAEECAELTSQLGKPNPIPGKVQKGWIGWTVSAMSCRNTFARWHLSRYCEALHGLILAMGVGARRVSLVSLMMASVKGCKDSHERDCFGWISTSSGQMKLILLAVNSLQLWSLVAELRKSHFSVVVLFND